MLDLRAGTHTLQEKKVQTLDPLTTSLSSKVLYMFFDFILPIFQPTLSKSLNDLSV